MKNRIIGKIINDKLNSIFGRIIIITGARQTGKTTLVKNTFKQFTYISIEDPVRVNIYKHLTSDQWAKNFKYAILDEIQKEPKLIESIKAVYDEYQEPKYLLLGSSQILLLKKVKESLAGRCIIIEMFPLTFPELLTETWKDKINTTYFQNLVAKKPVNDFPIILQSNYTLKSEIFENYLKYGAYPAINNKKLKEKEKYEWLDNYVKTYFERDIRDLVELKNLAPFTKINKLLAHNTGGIINYSNLAGDAGVSGKTVQRFIEYMNISYQVLILQPWHRNNKKRLVKSPKIHFMDPGIIRTLLQKRGDFSGPEFESAIISEIYKQLKYSEVSASVYHLRTSDGREIDLLIELEEGYIAIEIKSSEKIRATDGRHLRGIEDILDKPILHKLILSRDMEIKEFDSGIKAIPAIQFLF